MRVALSGASGFIGRHVLNALIKEDVEIFALTRHPKNLIGINSSINVLPIDIGEAHDDTFKKIGSPDVLIHLAWDGLPDYKSLHHFEIELPKHYRFLKSAINSGLKNLFVSGTCFEYGMQSGELAPMIRTEPANPYGFAKDALRKQLEFLKSNKPFNFTWGRFFYMYGEGQASNSLYPQLKQAVLRGDKVFNMSGGQQLRDYLPVETLAKRVIELALAQQDIGVINVCSGKPISVKEIVQQWVKDNNWKIGLNLGHYPYPDYEPMEFWGLSVTNTDI